MFVFVVALFASLLVHLPIYSVLGVLSDFFEAQQVASAVDEPVTISFVDDDVEDEEQSESEEPNAEVPRTSRPQEQEKLAEEEKRDEAKPPEPKAAAPEKKKRPPPKMDELDKQAIQQKSTNPNEPPPESKYVAEENSTVEEETVAELTNYVRDDEELSAGEQQEESDSPDLGNANEQDIADAREKEGSDQRTVTEEEAKENRPKKADKTPLPNTDAQGNTRSDGEQGRVARGDPTKARKARDQQGGEFEEITINDGNGTFVIRRPKHAGTGGLDGGGARREAVQGQKGGKRQAQGSQGRGRGNRQTGPNLRVSWSSYEKLMGDRLKQEREAYVQERLTKQRGNRGQHSKRFKKFRAAIENYVVKAKPGSQTALNAAASPFAKYVAAVHRRIHRQFAEKFIPRLPSFDGSPFADKSLKTKLEIIFNGDGSIHRVGVVRTSGFLPYDFGAYNAVMKGQPYSAPPAAIKSGDGRVYLHWSFYRNARQCGTFNAQPFILKRPPGSPPVSPGLRDGPASGGVVPANAKPSWSGEKEEKPSQGASTSHVHEDHAG